MRRRSTLLRGAGVACLASAGLMAVALVWPSSRDRIEVTLPGDQMRSAWIDPRSTIGALDASRVPSLALAIDLPRVMLLGREEELGLAVGISAAGGPTQVYSIAAEVVSADAIRTPPGESGQALRDGAAFRWTMVAARAPRVSATLLLRLRRHSAEGTAEAERLILARDLTLPVRTVAGLSAPVARAAAVALGLAGALLASAAAWTRTR